MARPAVSVAIAIGVVAVLTALGGATLADAVSPAVAHGLSHAFAGIPIAVLAFAAARRWPAPRTTPPARVARRLTVVGLAIFAAGQVLEILGARVDQPGATTFEGMAHTAGQVVTTLALLTAVVGGVLAVTAGVREGAIPVWIAVVVAALLAVPLLFILLGAPGS